MMTHDYTYLPICLLRWICVLPISVKNFLQPATQPANKQSKRRAELGSLLTDAEADELLHAGSNQPGGMGPILVLNMLRQLAFRATNEVQQVHVDAAVCARSASAASPYHVPPSTLLLLLLLHHYQVRAVVFRSLNEQLDILTGTCKYSSTRK